MNTRRQRSSLFRIMLTVAMMAAATNLMAGPLKVDSADPNVGIQSETLDVTIKGQGFAQATAVRFLVTGTGDTGHVSVTITEPPQDDTILARVEIAQDATVAFYDIEVQLSSGRKGKGTSKFAVQARQNPNQNLVDCSEFAPNGTCTCIFNKDEDLRIFAMQGDCETAETLWLNHARIISGGSTPSEAWPTLTAGADKDGMFHGSAVIANLDDAVGVRFLNIRFAPEVSRGCDPADDIQSALSFVLGEGTDDNPERASGLHVWDLTIDTHDVAGNDPLCTAIEVVREPGFTDPYATGNGNKEGQVFVTNVAIADGSYERIGIRYEGFQPLGFINPPLVNGNVIGAQACGPGSETARAIQFGRIQLSDLSDPSSQITGVVESNTIHMTTACQEGPGGVGILVVGEESDLSVTTAEITKNNVSGAFVGVAIDRNVAEANLSGNTLTGDGVRDNGDIGVCSDIQPPGATSTQGKPNKIGGYDDDDKFVFGHGPDGWCLPLP